MSTILSVSNEGGFRGENEQPLFTSLASAAHGLPDKGLILASVDCLAIHCCKAACKSESQYRATNGQRLVMTSSR